MTMRKNIFPFITLEIIDDLNVPAINIMTEHQLIGRASHSEQEWLFLMKQITAAFNLCFRNEDGDKHIFVTEESE